MLLLILGVALWTGAHFFKRLAPDARAKMGEKGRGPIALALLVSVVLMIIGYRMADGAVWWGRHPATVGINNLLMLLSIYLFAASGMKTWITSKTRHPQLNAFKVWAIAHLLVNGDLASVILFGGLLAWAVVQMILINKAEPDWVRPAGPFPRNKEIRAAVGAVVVYAVIVVIHTLLGYFPFG